MSADISTQIHKCGHNPYLEMTVDFFAVGHMAERQKIVIATHTHIDIGFKVID